MKLTVYYIIYISECEQLSKIYISECELINVFFSSATCCVVMNWILAVCLLSYSKSPNHKILQNFYTGLGHISVKRKKRKKEKKKRGHNYTWTCLILGFKKNGL